MAYAFSSIEELLQGGGTPPVQQSNIFAAEQAPTVGAQTQKSPEESSEKKTVDESSVGSTEAANPEATKGTDSASQTTNTQADKAALEANVGKTAKPSSLEGIRGQLAANTSRLQREADEYVTSEKGRQQYAPDSGTVQSATRANRDQGAFDYISGLLGRRKADPTGEFKASDVGVRDVDYLKTDAGVKHLLGRGQGPRYSSGMAEFDLRSLQKTPGFTQELGSLQRQQRNLLGSVGSTEGDVASQLAGYGQGQLESAQGDIRSQLGAAQTGLRDINQAEAEAYNRQLAGLDFDQIGADLRSSAAEQARLRLLGVDPNAARFIDTSAIGPMTDYISRGQDLGASDFVSADEAARYNNILALLGGGGQTWSESFPVGDPSASYETDQAALVDRLVADAQRRAGEEAVVPQVDAGALIDSDQTTPPIDQLIPEPQGVVLGGNVSPLEAATIGSAGAGGGGTSVIDSITGAPADLIQGAGVLGEGARDYLVDYAEGAPLGESLTGTLGKAIRSSEVEDARKAAEQTARFGINNAYARPTYGMSPRDWRAGSPIADIPASAARQAEEEYLRAKLIAANKAYDAEQAARDAVGGIVGGAKDVVGDVVSGAKDVGGDIARAYKTSIANPFKRFSRRF